MPTDPRFVVPTAMIGALAAATRESLNAAVYANLAGRGDLPPNTPIEAVIRDEMAMAYARKIGVPLRLVDRRPWVDTHREAHPAHLWGNGLGGCGHDACEGPRLRNLPVYPGIEAFRRQDPT